MQIEQERKKQKGISLIVLVITIIIMIILAGAIVLTLSNNGIINKASGSVDATNEANVRAAAQTAWAEAYLNTNRTQEKLEEYVLNKLVEQKINIDKYFIKVTENGVTVVKSVVDIVDTVPIPKGFVASQATGENKKDGGLVIYEGTEPVTDVNVEDAKRNRNQYVWVPVDDFETDFVKGKSYNKTFQNVPGTDNWEVVLDLNTNMPDIEENKKYSQYMTPTTLAEVQEVYKSVKEYKGFYIARYEVGLDIGKHKTSNDGIIIKSVHSKMNKAPYNYVRWTYNNVINEDTNGAIEVARSIYPESNENYGVVSTLAYGVQWDRTLDWFIETKAQNGTKDVTFRDDSIRDSTNYGNYKNNEIPNLTFNTGASVSKDNGQTYTTIDSTYSKKSNESHLLTTGATEESRLNNIYDMAGNVQECTMMVSPNSLRVYRGGIYNATGDSTGITDMSGDYDNIYAYNCYYGFRATLYIKKEH